MYIRVQVHIAVAQVWRSRTAGFPMMSPRMELRSLGLSLSIWLKCKYFDLLSRPACPLSSFSLAQGVLTLTLIALIALILENRDGSCSSWPGSLGRTTHTGWLVVWYYGSVLRMVDTVSPSVFDSQPMTSQSCHGLSFDSPQKSGECAFRSHLDFEPEIKDKVMESKGLWNHTYAHSRTHTIVKKIIPIEWGNSATYD